MTSNNEINMDRYYLHPGYIYAGLTDTIITTVLGSCISVSLWDKKNHFGGMNHYIFPEDLKNESSSKYGDVACTYLLKVMKDYGAKKENLVAHIVGGSSNTALGSDIGIKNALMAKKILKKQSIYISTWDVGGELGRKMIFNTSSGEILIYKGAKIREGDWY